MVPTNQKRIRFGITNLLLDNKEHIKTVYIHKDVEVKFQDSFVVNVEDLHDYLFGNITIFIKKNQRVCSGAKLPIKDLKSTEYVDVPLVAPENIKSADFLNKPHITMGHISFSLSIEDIPLKFKESKQKLQSVLLNTIFNKFMSDFMARIFNLTFVIQGGTLKCKIRAIFGFMVTQLFGNLLFHSCSGDHAESNCSDEDCFKKYGNIGVKRAKQGLKALHYSTIAYSHASFPIFAPKRLREVSNEDPIKAHILEHAIIKETDIFKIYVGDLNSATFIVFFDGSKLVVTFRGTCTTHELFNALDARYVPFTDGFAHSGLLRLAKKFLDDEWLGIRQMMQKRKCKSVLLTGHSLGGAVAIMVYLILKAHGDCLSGDKLVGLVRSDIKNIQITVFVFSAPPCVSKNIALKSYPDIVGFNYGHDTVPQLSFGSILDFKYLCLSIAIKRALLWMFFHQKDTFVAEINHIRAHLKSSNIHEKLFSPGTIYHVRAGRAEQEMVCKYRIVGPEFYGEIKHHINSLFSHMMIRMSDAFHYTIKQSHR